MHITYLDFGRTLKQDFDSCEASCDAWMFGDECSQRCMCNRSNTFNCTHIEGKCSCMPGWKGDTCSATCRTGTFGPNCIFNCTCKNGGHCNASSGICRFTITEFIHFILSDFIYVFVVVYPDLSALCVKSCVHQENTDLDVSMIANARMMHCAVAGMGIVLALGTGLVKDVIDVRL